MSFVFQYGVVPSLPRTMLSREQGKVEHPCLLENAGHHSSPATDCSQQKGEGSNERNYRGVNKGCGNLVDCGEARKHFCSCKLTVSLHWQNTLLDHTAATYLATSTIKFTHQGQSQVDTKPCIHTNIAYIHCKRSSASHPQ